jgi:hypothetical protein
MYHTMVHHTISALVDGREIDHLFFIYFCSYMYRGTKGTPRSHTPHTTGAWYLLHTTATTATVHPTTTTTTTSPKTHSLPHKKSLLKHISLGLLLAVHFFAVVLKLYQAQFLHLH